MPFSLMLALLIADESLPIKVTKMRDRLTEERVIAATVENGNDKLHFVCNQTDQSLFAYVNTKRYWPYKPVFYPHHRFDNEAPRQVRWSRSTENAYIDSDRENARFFISAASSQHVLIRLYEAAGELPVDVEFSFRSGTNSPAEALETLIAACSSSPVGRLILAARAKAQQRRPGQ